MSKLILQEEIEVEEICLRHLLDRFEKHSPPYLQSYLGNIIHHEDYCWMGEGTYLKIVRSCEICEGENE